jgi:hypothetical protein
MLRNRTTALALIPLAAWLLTACGTTPFEVTRIPQRDAEVYPASQSRQGVAVAVDAIGQKHRAKHYFGAPLTEAGVLPVNLTVSNHGEKPVRVQPGDVLLHFGSRVVDPLPVAKVAGHIQRMHGGMEPEAARELDRYLRQTAFAARLIGPGETYQGVMFFDLGRSEADPFRHVNVFSVFDAGGYRLEMRVTRRDSGERLAFGPFALVGLPSR